MNDDHDKYLHLQAIEGAEDVQGYISPPRKPTASAVRSMSIQVAQMHVPHRRFAGLPIPS